MALCALVSDTFCLRKSKALKPVRCTHKVFKKLRPAICHFFKGSHQKQKTEKVGLLDQPADPPLPVTWSKKNGKKNFNVYFAF